MDFYSNLPVNLQQPSLFEIISVDEIRKLLKPTLRYILTTYLQYRPSRLLLKVYNKFDFIVLVLKSLVEYRHLETTDATILDKFYGLRRYSKFNNKFALYFSIWFHDIFAEYFNDRFNEYHEILQSRKLTQQLTLWQQRFDEYYPKVVKGFKVINFCLKLKYLRDSKASNLIYLLGRVRYERYEQQATSPSVTLSRRKRTNLPRIISISKNLMESSSTMILDKLFPTFLVIIRVLQWINQQPQIFKEEIRVKRPKPPVLKSSQEMTGDICPLCNKKIHEPAMISTGYIACHQCIITWLASNSTCFITGSEIDNQVRRLLV